MFGGVLFAPFTGGASLAATYAGGAYLAADSGYSAITGHTMITGDQLSTEERIWAGIDAITSVASMGSAAYLTHLAKAGQSGSTLLKGLATAGRYTDDVTDVSKVIYATATGQDPTSAIGNLALGRGFDYGFGKVSGFVGKQFGKAPNIDVDVDLPSGQKPKTIDLDLSTAKASKAESAYLHLSKPTGQTVDLHLPSAKQVSKAADVDVPKVQPQVDPPNYNREQILKNLEESRKAREASNFDQYLTRESLIKYPTLLDGKVKIVDRAELPDWIRESFTDGNYRTVITTEETTLYRTFGGYSDAGGGFVTTTAAQNRTQAKIDTALLPEWKNTRKYEAVIKIPKGTELNIGKVAPQKIESSGFVLKGGADQVLLPNPWPLDWIVEIRIVPN